MPWQARFCGWDSLWFCLCGAGRWQRCFRSGWWFGCASNVRQGSHSRPATRRGLWSYPSHQSALSRAIVVADSPAALGPGIGYSGKRFVTVARGNPFQIKPGQQFFDGFGFAQIGRKGCRSEPGFLGGVAPVPHARHLDRHRTDPGHDLAFRQMPVAHQPRATVVRFLRCVGLEQN